jgi:hypothetical protein
MSNSGDRAESFRHFAETLRDHSKEVFLKDRTHGEMFFLVNELGEGNIIMAPPKQDRNVTAESLRQRICEEKIYGVVHIAESWTYFPRSEGDHTMKQIALGEIKVAELSPGDRTEALVVMAQSRDGFHCMWVTPIIRDGDQVRLGPTIDFEEPAGGRLADLFESS